MSTTSARLVLGFVHIDIKHLPKLQNARPSGSRAPPVAPPPGRTQAGGRRRNRPRGAEPGAAGRHRGRSPRRGSRRGRLTTRQDSCQARLFGRPCGPAFFSSAVFSQVIVTLNSASPSPETTQRSHSGSRHESAPSVRQRKKSGNPGPCGRRGDVRQAHKRSATTDRLIGGRESGQPFPIRSLEPDNGATFVS